MLNEPRVYRHPPLQIGFTILIYVVLAFIFFTSFDASTSPILLSFGIILLLIAAYSLYALTGRTTISDSEISVQTLLGTRSLAWSEISNVSGRNSGIRLHNFDGDLAVSPSPQLPGYEEVIEWIGTKRPDLFNPQEDEEMRRSRAILLLTAISVVLIVGIGALTVIQSGQWFMSIFFVLVGVVILVVIAASPQSITLHRRSLLLRYLFSEKTLLVNEIKSIQLISQRTRNGKSYHVRLDLQRGGGLRLSGLGLSLPILYLRLKNWHKRSS
jgi:hypothetical protein